MINSCLTYASIQYNVCNALTIAYFRLVIAKCKHLHSTDITTYNTDNNTVHRKETERNHSRLKTGTVQLGYCPFNG